MLKKVLSKLIRKFLSNDKPLMHTKGKRYFSNSLVDTLVPDFVEIGDNFISAPGSIILAHDSSLYLFTKKYRIQKTKIGNNVFLGANSVILAGVLIGDNVIIGAGAIVTKDVQSNSVMGGNPAKYLCSVEDYCEKCEEKGVLFDAPNSLKESFEIGKKFSDEILKEFRTSVNTQYRNSNNV
jgi:NDP-sugar pyrophosphorylase family protein